MHLSVEKTHGRKSVHAPVLPRRAVERCLSVLVTVSLTATSVMAQNGAARPQAGAGVAWSVTDDLGRTLPGVKDAGPLKHDRFVGIFYFLWLNERDNKSPHWNGPYDVSRILQADPDALKKPDSPLWGPIGRSHYWGEPLCGYYCSQDPWVVRRHAMLLADAGIDALIFDTTNAITYRDTYMKLCEVFRQMRQEGEQTPQITFMVNTEAGKTAQALYDELYKPGLYSELWFRWQGKPLLICDPEEASPELRKFFTLRAAHWPFKLVNTKNRWHWESTYPQVYSYAEDPDKPEQVNVAVAQNLRASDGAVTNMSNGDARGRSFHDGKMDTSPGAVNHGYNFQEQWKRALELAPPFVMVTGWNEWIAGRWGEPHGPIAFVDQMSEEYSRDIEPMKGGHGDNYYYQLVSNVRQYKGVAPLAAASVARTIAVDGDFNQWRSVRPEFRDHVGETAPRDFPGAAGLTYTNKTGRNDIVACKVARDAKNVYFYVRTREPLTPSTDPNWMWLLIDADGDAKTGWNGCEFIINRTVTGEGKSTLEKHAGKWDWTSVASVSFASKGNELQLAVPRSALGIGDGDAFSLNFKWIDNAQQPGDVMDLYVSGDTAPEGRFTYPYRATK